MQRTHWILRLRSCDFQTADHALLSSALGISDRYCKQAYSIENEKTGAYSIAIWVRLLHLLHGGFEALVVGKLLPQTLYTVDRVFINHRRHYPDPKLLLFGEVRNERIAGMAAAITSSAPTTHLQIALARPTHRCILATGVPVLGIEIKATSQPVS